MRRALFVSCTLIFAACSSSSSKTDDGGVVMMKDMAESDGPPVAPPDMAVAPNIGQKLLPGTYRLIHLTSDDHVVAIDDANSSLVAINLATKKVNEVAQLPPGVLFSRRVQGKGVWAFTGVDMQTNIATTNFWTSATGVNQITPMGKSFLGSASDDGAFIAYATNPAPDGNSTDISIAKADGTGATTIAMSLDETQGVCTVELAFRNGKFFIIGCPTAMGANGNQTLWVVDAATMKVISTTPDLLPNDEMRLIGAISNSGDKVFAIDATKAGVVIDTATGKPTKIDSDVVKGLLTPDGTTAVYVNVAGAVMTSPTAMPSPKQLVPASGVKGFGYYRIGTEQHAAMSPDGKYVMYTKRTDPAVLGSASFTGDLFMTSTTTAAAPVTLTTDDTGALFGDAFTTDIAHALYYPKTLNVALIGGLIGPFESRPVAGGTAAKLGDDVWVSYAAKGGIVFYNDNYQRKPPAKSGTHGRYDLRYIDTNAGASVLVAATAEGEFFVTADKSQVVYASLLNTMVQGIYTFKLP